MAASKSYGGVGLALVRSLAEHGHATFSVHDARESAMEIGLAASGVRLLLHRLARAGLLQRIKRGKYTLTPMMPGAQAPHPFVVGMALADPCAVSGWAALNHHGLTEQIPNAITLTTPRRVVTPAMRGTVRAPASTWEVSGQTFEFVTVVSSHFFGYEDEWFGDSRARVFTRERALLDCFALPRRFGGLAEGLAILEEHLKQLELARFVEYARQYGEASVARRVGFALDQAGAKATVVKPLRALALSGYRPLDPTRPPRGKRNSRWGLIENLSTTSDD